MLLSVWSKASVFNKDRYCGNKFCAIVRTDHWQGVRLFVYFAERQGNWLIRRQGYHWTHTNQWHRREIYILYGEMVQYLQCRAVMAVKKKFHFPWEPSTHLKTGIQILSFLMGPIESWVRDPSKSLMLTYADMHLKGKWALRWKEVLRKCQSLI